MNIINVYLVFFLLFVSCQESNTQSVYFDFDKSSIDFQIRYGDSVGYEMVGNYTQLDSLTGIMLAEYQLRIPNKKEWLVYTHSLYGAAPIYSDLANWVIRKKIVDSTANVLVRVQWGSWNPFYEDNQKIAFQKGKYLGRVLNVFLKQGFTINTLHHSMGSKMLQGALPELDSLNRFSQVFLVAPDIDESYILQDSALIANHVNRLHCFHTKNDIFLWIAEKLNDSQRLGNIDSAYIELPFITYYNTNEMDCLFNNNHVNWLTCGEVQAIIRKVLMDKGHVEGNTITDN